MNIFQAVRATKGYGWITRRSWDGRVQICPTNEPECCVCKAEGEELCPRWQPYAQDLMADDWELCE